MIILLAVIFITICVYIAYLQYSSQYTIRIISRDVEQWEGWNIKYTLDELSAEYPEFLPFVEKAASCLPTTHRRTGEGDTIFWEDGDGVYFFDEIYSKKRISNYFHHLPSNATMPQAYLRTDRRGYLKPELGRNIQKGTYYINKWVYQHNGDPSIYAKGFALYGFFIEIQQEGWRIASFDMYKNDIISLTASGESERIKCAQYISPLLEFNKKYKLQGKSHREKEIIIIVGKGNNDDRW